MKKIYVAIPLLVLSIIGLSIFHHWMLTEIKATQGSW